MIYEKYDNTLNDINTQYEIHIINQITRRELEGGIEMQAITWQCRH